jgi:hypothetical protein
MMLNRGSTLSRSCVRFVAGLGIAIDAALFVFKAPGPFTWSTHLFALWLMLAWIVALVLAWRPNPSGLVHGVLACGVFEALAFYLAFVAPGGSTAALIYAVKPVWQLGLLLLAIIGGILIARHRDK